MHKLTPRITVLCSAMFVAACAPVDDVTPRLFVSLVAAHAAPIKIEIAKSLVANPGKSVPQAGALQLPPPPGLAPMKFDFGWVTNAGAIIIQSNKYAVVVVQEPVVGQDGVKWSCIVHPSEAKPNLCGSDYQNSTLHERSMGPASQSKAPGSN